MIRNFEELIEKVQNLGELKRVALVCAHDIHALEAVAEASEKGIVAPILIGDALRIQGMIEAEGLKFQNPRIIHEPEDAAAAGEAVRLVHQGEADFIMKGGLQTAVLLKAVVDKNNGLKTGGLISHLAFNEIPGYPKLLVTTDGGMVMYPDLEQKKQILVNAVTVLRNLGYECPKVAVLAAVETVNPKMPETLDGDALKEMNLRGEIGDCIVEGPISYDLAMNHESAVIKGYTGNVTGDADILLVPDITAGNILGKALVYSAGARMAGMVVGSRVPIVLTSRGASAEEKYLSLVLCAASAEKQEIGCL